MTNLKKPGRPHGLLVAIKSAAREEAHMQEPAWAVDNPKLVASEEEPRSVQ
jgi:hypothetical protein